MTTTRSLLRSLAPAVALVSVLAPACAGSPIPVPLPPDAAASLLAPEAPIPGLTVALEEDPPLPGEETRRWPGLGDAEALVSETGAPHAR